MPVKIELMLLSRSLSVLPPLEKTQLMEKRRDNFVKHILFALFCSNFHSVP